MHSSFTHVSPKSYNQRSLSSLLMTDAFEAIDRVCYSFRDTLEIPYNSRTRDLEGFQRKLENIKGASVSTRFRPEKFVATWNIFRSEVCCVGHPLSRLSSFQVGSAPRAKTPIQIVAELESDGQRYTCFHVLEYRESSILWGRFRGFDYEPYFFS